MPLPTIALVVLVVLSEALCETCPYLKYSPNHTGCKERNPSCNFIKTGVPQAEKAEILKLHNYYRNKVATGQETRAGGLPQAANMMELSWDDELAAIAQKQTETCVYGHDCNDCRKVARWSYTGQNIGYKSFWGNWPATETGSADWKWLVDVFYNEVQYFNKAYVDPYVWAPNPEKTYGHFSQVVWAQTHKVGCGWSLYKEGTWVKSYMVCNYGTGGNIIGAPMYKIGSACSACPKNTCCGNSCSKSGKTFKYPGLCTLINENLNPEGAQL